MRLAAKNVPTRQKNQNNAKFLVHVKSKKYTEMDKTYAKEERIRPITAYKETKDWKRSRAVKHTW